MKVASIKHLSIPRLEWCGTLMVTNLLLHCVRILGVPLESTYAWTDSTVVLSWLRRDPSQFNPFVGNRVADIMNKLLSNSWHHVSESSNLPTTYRISSNRGLLRIKAGGMILRVRGNRWVAASMTAKCEANYVLIRLL